MNLEDITGNVEMIALILLFIVVSILKMVEIYLKKTKKIDTETLDLLSEELTNLKTIITNSDSLVCISETPQVTPDSKESKESKECKHKPQA